MLTLIVFSKIPRDDKLWPDPENEESETGTADWSLRESQHGDSTPSFGYPRIDPEILADDLKDNRYRAILNSAARTIARILFRQY